MDHQLFSIGEAARTSGLSVSALRFYDREGVLTPTRVDPVTAYRWYSGTQLEEARLVASLRRVGLALPEISTILAHRGEPEVLHRLLSEHVARLEEGLAAAKGEICRIQATWGTADDEAPVTVSADAGDLRRAFASVRFAVGVDRDFPALHGVMVELSGPRLRLTATDRHRAAFCEIQVSSRSTAGVRAVVAAECLDELDAYLDHDGTASLTVGSRLEVQIDQSSMECSVLDVDFPDLSRVVHQDAAASLPVDGSWLARALLGAPEVDRCWLGVDHEGAITLSLDGATAADSDLLLDAEFLSQAVDAVGNGQLRLEFGGPVAPLAIRSVDDPGCYSVLMPIRRD